MNSYGKVVFTAGNWALRLEPQVATRAKRVFPRIRQSKGTDLWLSATPENSRDLRWFLERYPAEIDAASAGTLDRLASEHVQMERSIADLLAGHVPPPAGELAKPLRDYQREAWSYLRVRGGLLLGDAVGTGKTITAIGPMADPDFLPAVVVRPAYMPGHWEGPAGKLAEFAPHLRVHLVNHGTPYSLVRTPGDRRQRADLWDELPDVIVVTYHMLRGWSQVLAGLCRYLIFDEVQQLRHDGTQIYAAASTVASAARWKMGLSATPIYNYGSEFFSVIEPLVPGALGSRDEFIREWCTAAPGGNAKLQDSEQFGQYLRREGVLLMRSRADIGRELPPVQKLVHEIPHDPKELERLSGDAVALARVVLAQSESFRGERMNASGQFETIMRQATGLAKAPFVASFVRMLVESGEKVLVYGWHHAVYRLWEERWRQAGIKSVFYTGEDSPKEKLQAKADFVDGDAQVLVMSLRSGAGVDGLQDVCSTVVFGELDWSPGVHEQCIGRVDRDLSDRHADIHPSAQRPTIAYFLTATDGCDPIMIDVLGVKREQLEGVRDPGGQLVQRLDIGTAALRKLAQEVLARRGEAVPVDATVTGHDFGAATR